MSRQPVGISSLRRSRFAWSSGPRRLPAIVWWPSSLPGADLDERPRRKAPPARRRFRRGRIQLVAA